MFFLLFFLFVYLRVLIVNKCKNKLFLFNHIYFKIAGYSGGGQRGYQNNRGGGGGGGIAGGQRDGGGGGRGYDNDNRDQPGSHANFGMRRDRRDSDRERRPPPQEDFREATAGK
jgi:hypothetical protein